MVMIWLPIKISIPKTSPIFSFLFLMVSSFLSFMLPYSCKNYVHLVCKNQTPKESWCFPSELEHRRLHEYINFWVNYFIKDRNEKNPALLLTICWISHGIRLGVIVHTVYQLWTNRGTIIFHCFDLRWTRRRVRSKNGLTEFSAVCVMTCVTAAHRAHYGKRDDTEMQTTFC